VSVTAELHVSLDDGNVGLNVVVDTDQMLRRMSLYDEDDAGLDQDRVRPETEQQQQQPDRRSVGGLWSWMTSATTHGEDEEKGRGRTSTNVEEQDMPDSDEIIKRRRLSRIGR